MDELGYYCLWTAEHHFQHEGYECLPNLIQLGLWLATQTQAPQIRLRLQRPADVAPDPARRRLCDGRHRHRRARHHGRRARLPHPRGRDVRRAAARHRRQPRDLRGAAAAAAEMLQRGVVPATRASTSNARRRSPIAATSSKEITWCRGRSTCRSRSGMPIASGRTIDLMAQHGIKAMVTLNGEKILDDVVRAYHAACQRHGRDVQLGEDMIWGAGIYLADSQEEAIRRVEPSHDERYKWFAPFGFVRYADEQGRTWGTPGAPARLPTLARRRGAEGVVLRPARAGHRRHQVDRGEVSRPRGFHDPLGRRAAARRVQGAAALVRPRGDAGLPLCRGARSVLGLA